MIDGSKKADEERDEQNEKIPGESKGGLVLLQASTPLRKSREEEEEEEDGEGPCAVTLRWASG